MTYLFKQIGREWRFMLRQRYVLILLLCSFLVSGFAVFTGLAEVAQQQQTIERLKLADVRDRLEAQAKYNDPGSLAYYSFHLTYSEPSSLAFAALGERDVYPWKHRVRMLALEGQIYESDSQNAELAQAGKIDFVFVISALAPFLPNTHTHTHTPEFKSRLDGFTSRCNSSPECINFSALSSW